MYREVTGLLFHPGGFFARKQQEAICLFVPAVIVGIGGIVTFLSPILEVAATRGDISGFIGEPAADLWFLLLPFALWLIVSGLLFLFCRLLSGTGSFSATLQNCGYGYLPQTLLSPFLIINGIAAAWYPAGAQSVLLHGIMILLGIPLFLGLFWSAVLWTAAMEKTHSLPRSRAVIGPFLVLLLSELPLLLVILTAS